MNDRITAGAAALMGALVVGTGMVRWAVRPTPSQRPYGAPADRRIVDCPQCAAPAAATVHGSLLRCDNGHDVQAVTR